MSRAVLVCLALALAGCRSSPELPGCRGRFEPIDPPKIIKPKSVAERTDEARETEARETEVMRGR